MRVLSVDPGGTTGLALFLREDVGGAEDLTTSHTDEPMDALERAREHALSWDFDTVVCESFQLTAATLKKTRGGSLTAIELIGALRWLCHRRSVNFVLQSPADARTFSTDAKLKALGWWPTNDHERSAVRHLVLYLAKTGVLTPARMIRSLCEEG